MRDMHAHMHNVYVYVYVYVCGMRDMHAHMHNVHVHVHVHICSRLMLAASTPGRHIPSVAVTSTRCQRSRRPISSRASMRAPICCYARTKAALRGKATLKLGKHPH